MSSQASRTHERYGAIAFAAVVLACYLQFVIPKRLTGEPWQVVLSFVLGALYSALFLLAPKRALESRPWLHGYFAVQCALLTAILFVSPVAGFFGLLVMPLASQAIGRGRFWIGTATGAYLFALCVVVAGYRYGTGSMLGAAVSYVAAFGFVMAFTLLTVQATEARDRAEQLQSELESANTQLREQAARMEELATVRERNRLAREIHDGVGHYLTVIKVQLDAAAALLPADPERAAASVTKAARLAGESLDEMRRSVSALTGGGSRPLVDTLQELAADGAPPARLRIEGTPRALPHAVEHALFRTAQEGLTNIRKHAHATTASLVVDFRTEHQVRLILEDDGRGAASGGNGDSFGLRGLRERIALLGGTLDAGDRPTGGFRLSVNLPA